MVYRDFCRRTKIISICFVLFACLPVTPVTASALDCEKASHRHNDGAYEEAVSLYKTCIRSIKKTANRRILALMYTLRGRSYLELNDLENAESDFKKALRTSKKEKRTYLGLGTLNSKKGDHKEAIANFEKSIELDPQFAVAYVSLGFEYHMIGEYQRSIEYYNQALELRPNYTIAIYNRGLAKAKDGQYAEAIADFEKAIQLNPNDGNIYNDLAWNLATAKDANVVDLEKAHLQVNKSIALNETSSGRDTLAAVLALKGNFDEAVTNQKRAIELLEVEGEDEALAAYTARLKDYQNKVLPNFGDQS